ncbi:hypothetical protein JTE90_023669 [Oedothorax gibbosus]|uniref:Uncharacterized protein n=1 Tax=Oedothorax gibbosus TaxID=931172 RepID=A0AAV6U6X0_9ARAC|nr:hypothetical protein JTE90_023669 [Oedothorax gibbosus]
MRRYKTVLGLRGKTGSRPFTWPRVFPAHQTRPFVWPSPYPLPSADVPFPTRPHHSALGTQLKRSLQQNPNKHLTQLSLDRNYVHATTKDLVIDSTMFAYAGPPHYTPPTSYIAPTVGAMPSVVGGMAGVAPAPAPMPGAASPHSKRRRFV